MNRWVLPGSVAAALVAVTAAATIVGAQPVAEPPVSASPSRVSIVCPAFESVTAQPRVAAVSAGTGLRTAPLTRPNQSEGATGLKVLSGPSQPVRVSAVLPGPFGASTVVVSAAGPDRGYSAASCGAPRTDHWFTGVDLRADAQSEVVVANLDGTGASVDLTVYGERGRISARRGVEVEGNAAETISLGNLPRGAAPVTVHAASSDGRVAAFLRQRSWDGETPLGADWLPPSADPATDLVLAGIPEGDGLRRLVVTNPGDRTATVTIGVLGESGPIELAGSEQLEVPAEATRTVDLTGGLDGQPAALKLASTQPVTAGMWLDTAAGDAKQDPAYTAAIEPLPEDGLWPLAGGRAAATVLQLANPTGADATVTVTAGSGSNAGNPREVTVTAGSTVEVDLAAASATMVRIRTTATGLRGALVSRLRLDGTDMLAILPLAGQEGGGAAAQVRFDPHAGS